MILYNRGVKDVYISQAEWRCIVRPDEGIDLSIIRLEPDVKPNPEREALERVVKAAQNAFDTWAAEENLGPSMARLLSALEALAELDRVRNQK